MIISNQGKRGLFVPTKKHHPIFFGSNETISPKLNNLTGENQDAGHNVISQGRKN